MKNMKKAGLGFGLLSGLATVSTFLEFRKTKKLSEEMDKAFKEDDDNFENIKELGDEILKGNKRASFMAGVAVTSGLAATTSFAVGEYEDRKERKESEQKLINDNESSNGYLDFEFDKDLDDLDEKEEEA